MHLIYISFTKYISNWIFLLNLINIDETNDIQFANKESSHSYTIKLKNATERAEWYSLLDKSINEDKVIDSGNFLGIFFNN